MQRGFISRSLLVAFLLILAIVPLVVVVLPNKAAVNKKILEQDNAILAKVAEAALSATPIPQPSHILLSKTPTPIYTIVSITVKPKRHTSSPVQAPTIKSWTTYNNNEVLNNAFSFSYPDSWQVQYKKNSKESNSYLFTFNLENKTQIMTISMFPKASSVEAFINTNYSQDANKLMYETFGEIGNQTLYSVSPKNTIKITDPIYTIFGSRGVVLADQYTYTISFDQNSDLTMITAIEQTIWPACVFR